MAKFDANAFYKLGWGIIGGRFDQQVEPHDGSLAEFARSTYA
jgi:hypothetical protein